MRILLVQAGEVAVIPLMVWLLSWLPMHHQMGEFGIGPKSDDNSLDGGSILAGCTTRG